ncbi:hypothetical protein LCGC14_2278720 [marine sediment metagenome]|uniref:Uncharacterized protein n=1 Tax=marine sediment metagenome TaxID=412755 RepID=A0A0F9DH06_9ZZZZ
MTNIGGDYLTQIGHLRAFSQKRIDLVEPPSLVCNFDAPGKPRPKGNIIKGRFGGYHDATKGLDKWLLVVRGCARAAMRDNPIITCPVTARLAFCFVRPKGHFTLSGTLSAKGRREPLPTTRTYGDIDKLARAILDALTGIVYKDDCLVTPIEAGKTWAEKPGVRVIIIRTDVGG